jgi:hypothetical protein
MTSPTAKPSSTDIADCHGDGDVGFFYFSCYKIGQKFLFVLLKQTNGQFRRVFIRNFAVRITKPGYEVLSITTYLAYCSCFARNCREQREGSLWRL